MRAAGYVSARPQSSKTHRYLVDDGTTSYNSRRPESIWQAGTSGARRIRSSAPAQSWAIIESHAAQRIEGTATPGDVVLVACRSTVRSHPRHRIRGVRSCSWPQNTGADRRRLVLESNAIMPVRTSSHKSRIRCRVNPNGHGRAAKYSALFPSVTRGAGVHQILSI